MKKVLVIIALASVSIAFLPSELLATTSSDFGGAALDLHASKVQGFLFGPVLKFAAIFGSAVGIMYSYFVQAYARIVGFVALAIGSMVMPQFINSVFSLMLP
jgi:type IV secretory pathway VirB2 component (pilin)